MLCKCSGKYIDIYFILKITFNPLEHILEDCEVDNGLEHLFSLESMGRKKLDKELVSFDEYQINPFASIGRKLRFG